MKKMMAVFAVSGVFSIFPACMAHGAMEEEGNPVNLAGMDFSGHVPAFFRGECFRGTAGWMVRIRELNGHEPDKETVTSLKGVPRDFMAEQGKRCTGILCASVPGGMEGSPQKWTVRGKKVCLVRDDVPAHAAQMEEAVLGYYEKEIMDGIGRYVSVLDQMTDKEKLFSMNRKMLEELRNIAGMVQLESSMGLEALSRYVENHPEIAAQSEKGYGMMRKAMARWQKRFGFDVLEWADAVTGERPIRLWGVPFSFSFP